MNFLIVDYGTSSCRASIVNDAGKITSSCRKPTLVENRGSLSEINIGQAWTVVVSVIRELLENTNYPEIDAVGVSSLLGWVFLDSSNNPADNSIIWMDSRGSSELTNTIEKYKHDIYKNTGRRLSPELLVSKWAWFKENAPETASATSKIFGLKDEFVRRLTGEVITDFAHLNYTMLWNIREHRLDSQMLELADLNPGLLPEGGYPYSKAGTITAEAAAATGLQQGIPVIRGSIDGTTAMYGGGMASPDSAVLVSGTTDVVMTLIDAEALPALDGNDVLTVNTGMVPGTFAAGGSTGVSGGALTKIAELLDGSYTELLAAAENVEPGSDGLIFSPGLSGERAPYWNAGITGGLYGLRMEHSGAHIFNAVMEGASFRLKRLFTELFRDIPVPAYVYTVGGCSDIAIWNQIKTDIIGIPFIKPSELEATTMGTAMFCSCFINNTDNMASLSKSWLKPECRYSVRSEYTGIYEKQFVKYENLLKRTVM